jgi:hypothetical protein
MWIQYGGQQASPAACTASPAVSTMAGRYVPSDCPPIREPARRARSSGTIMAAATGSAPARSVRRPAQPVVQGTRRSSKTMRTRPIGRLIRKISCQNNGRERTAQQYAGHARDAAEAAEDRHRPVPVRTGRKDIL